MGSIQIDRLKYRQSFCFIGILGHQKAAHEKCGHNLTDGVYVTQIFNISQKQKLSQNSNSEIIQLKNGEEDDDIEIVELEDIFGPEPESEDEVNHLDTIDNQPIEDIKLSKKLPKIEIAKDCKQNEKSISIFKFFKVLNYFDMNLCIMAFIFCFTNGLVLPIIAIAMGEVTDAYDPSNTGLINDLMLKNLKWICMFGAYIWLTGYVYYALFERIAETVAIDLRGKYLRALLKQEIAFFEKNHVESMPSDFGQYFNTISRGIGESFAQLLQSLGVFIGGIAIAFYKGPYFTLASLAYFPIMMTFLFLIGRQNKKAATVKLEANRILGGYTEECLSALKLIVSFANEKLAMLKYREKAEDTRISAYKANKLLSIFFGLFRGFIFGLFAYNYYIGTLFIEWNFINPSTGQVYNISEIVSIQLSLMIAVMQIFRAVDGLGAFSKALAVGAKVFEVIEREPLIQDAQCSVSDTRSINSIRLEKGITFTDVRFRYPTAPEFQPDTLQGVNFTIKAGTSTAIVGPSGSGKSTIVQMLERFYDPDEGAITFDDQKLKHIQLNTLRQSIGYVSQEPALIIGTVLDNLRYANKDASIEQMQTALKKANAYHFLQEMEDGINTYVGSSALQNMSGGQKQRIAIARCLIKNPTILILDEATSALDPKSEQEVQQAILNIAQEDNQMLTTIMIAHRLQTIETAQNLLYIESPSKIIGGQKGSREYAEIMEKLKTENYKHQQKQASKEQVTPVIDSGDGIIQVDAHVQSLTPSDGGGIVAEAKDKLQRDIEEGTVAQAHAKDTGFFRVMKYYNPKSLAYLSVLISTVCGLAYPLCGYMICELTFIIIRGPSIPTYRADRNTAILQFLVLCILMGFFGFLQKFIFAVTGENLTYKVRTELFESLLHKQVAWFDKQDKAPGILSNILSEDISNLNGLTTETISMFSETFTTLAAGILLACFFSWRMAIVTIVAVPFLMLGGLVMTRLGKAPPSRGARNQKQNTSKMKKVDAYQESNALLADVILNYRTVISFGQSNVDNIMQTYENLLVGPKATRIREAHLCGIAWGYSQAVRFFFVGILFYIGSVFIVKYQLDFKNVFQAQYILFITAMGAGQAVSSLPSALQAKQSAKKIFNIIDEPSKCDIRKQSSKISLIPRGQIELKNVTFKYPSRDVEVLKNMTFKIEAGQKVGLVGHSGCGKSTITNLLLRFYEFSEGEFLIDGKRIQDYDVGALRQQIGYVMQEPVLFNASIRDNIAFGQPNCTNAKIMRVADMANARQFIETSLEDLTVEQQVMELKQKIQANAKRLDLNPVTISFVEKVNSLKILTLVNSVLQNGDHKFIETLRQNKSELERALSLPSLSSWSTLIIFIEWKVGVIEALRSTRFYQRLSRYEKEEMEEYVNVYPFQFHTEFFLDFIKQVDEQGVDLEVVDSFFLQALDSQKLAIESVMKVNKASRQKELNDNLFKRDQNLPLHEGYSRSCGLKGSKLSGGQKQRIAIARALIKDPKIIILDEATSALDENSQEIVQEALDRAMEGRTSIVIAHRLSTIRNCDVLFIIDQGKVVETGSYQQLSQRKGSHFNRLKAGMEM